MSEMEDRYLEVLLRLDESVRQLTVKVNDSIVQDRNALEHRRKEHQLLSDQVQGHAREITQLTDQFKQLRTLDRRVTELEFFKRILIYVAAAVSSVMTLVINKIMSLWHWG